jgi:hypothetical protein
MVMPSAPQAALLDQGVRPDVIGTHVVGVVSGLSVPLCGMTAEIDDHPF